ncbi:adenosylmethionine-8-amino-7-oxononanoate aminotransferase [Mycobacterium xenopi 3993]|nr:adenosylmethionine-8-amino-7-oxononanoate aminotransferase [Mycobacterium xenopi 3993]
MTWRGGYHGDTFTPMSICDPDGGMHKLWADVLAQQVFARRCRATTTRATARRSRRNWPSTPANWRPWSSNRWCRARAGCASTTPLPGRPARHLRPARVLLIFDEIATGFGRTGELFAADHVEVSPDIMCVGKALTGGYLSLAATLCTTDVAHRISSAGPLLHGPPSWPTRWPARCRWPASSCCCGTTGERR